MHRYLLLCFWGRAPYGGLYKKAGMVEEKRQGIIWVKVII